jgi:arylsulfatase A-like enzyme
VKIAANRKLWIIAITLLVLAVCVFPRKEKARPNVLLITVDTLRADRLGCYGSTLTHTPNIDRLAREGLLFENAAVPMPITLPSHVSMMTSLYPRDHGVINNAIALSDDVVTLPDLVKQAGYQTAGFVAVRLLAPDSGVAGGFDRFDFPQQTRQRPAPDVVPLATKWLRSRGSSDPFFLWLHLFDPHMPYAPPPPYNQSSSPHMVESLPEFSWPGLFSIVDKTGGDLPKDSFDRALALYDGEVEYVDHWLGVILDALQELGSLDSTVLVFTADHGECFSHGVFFEHSSCLYDGAVTVPLIFRYPKAIAEGVRVASQVETLDIAPTILALLGIPIPDDFLGRSLLELSDSPLPETERYAFLQHAVYQDVVVERRRERSGRFKSVGGEPTRPVRADQQVGLRSSEWKYILSQEQEELYDLELDPAELRNLAEDRADVVRRLRPILRRWMSDHPLKVRDPGKISPELLDTLKALGYQ